jgi:hypothetical protein
MKLRSNEIPQADTLSTIRQLIEAINQLEVPSTPALIAATGFSERHVQYRLSAARALGLVTPRGKDTALTSKGKRLVSTGVGSAEEKAEFRRAVRACPAVRQIDPELLSKPSVNKKDLADRIMRVSDLSRETALRRADVLSAWHRDLVEG